jgi:cytochrome-b5 reductase
VTAEINGKAVIRNYTPVSLPDDKGYFDLLIKTYEKGNISRYVTTLNPGDRLRVKGPKGNFKYTPNLVSHLGMIAGGTGIAPMIQIIRAVLRNPEDKTTVSLLYANVNEADILLHKELQDLEAAHSKRFKIYYVLNNPPAGWTGGVGFVTKEHIQTYLQNPGETSSKILICGPPPMVAAMKKNLDELKYPLPNTISKLPDPVFVF